MFIFPQVKHWLTLNEPWVSSVQGYGVGDHAPGVKEPADGVYEAAHNLIRAHAKAYRAYEKDFKPTQEGNFERLMLYLLACQDLPESIDH